MSAVAPVALRNVAIIAHVDHGKTTLVDHMLRQSGTFRENEAVVDRVMDSLDLERERGITILSKNTAVEYFSAKTGERVKINIIDTPGHADFGGEVERVLKMADGALLLVDASEGPLPQTRFVLEKALEAKLTVLVCINKIDRPDARVEEVVDEVYDLFIDLGANDKQIEFPILYACARDGYCHETPVQQPGDLRPLFEAILAHVPPPGGDPAAPVQLLVTTLDYDNYVGRLAVGRIFNGTVRPQDELLLVGAEGRKKVKVVQLYTFKGLERIETDEAGPGELVAIAGIDELDIGDTLTGLDAPRPLPRLHIDEPTIGITFLANSGPFAGREGRPTTARMLRERLEKEARHNPAIRIDESEDMRTATDRIRVFGRGELQLAILIEQMRREGYEMCASKPEVRFRVQNGRRLEPFEIAVLDFPDVFMGVVTEKMALRKGQMTQMKMGGSGRVRCEFRVPSRGLIGFRGEYLNDTRGQGIVHTLFDGWDDAAGYIPYRINGSLVADRAGLATAYALYHLQDRGKLFVKPGVEVYEGMIVGEHSRQNDLNVNVCRAKQLTNLRTVNADEKLILAPPVQLTLEKALEFIAEDELVEITPSHIRLRKKVLPANRRSIVRGERRMSKA